MPAAIEYLPPTDSKRDALSLELITERSARRDRYLNALAYYNGKHPEQLDYDPDDEPNDNATINLVQITADRTTSFLFPEIPKFQTDPNAVDETDEEKWSRKLIDESGGLVFLVRLGLRGFLSGHAFVRVKPGRVYGKRRTPPKLILLDPLAVTVYWAADDVGDVLWYENRYRAGDDVYIEDYVWMPEAGEAGEWWIYTYKTEKKSDYRYLTDSGLSPHGAGVNQRFDTMDYLSHENFKLVETPEGKPFARHSSPIAPIIEFGHLPHPDDRYGHGEVNQTDLQDTINRVWSEINRIVRKHSDPMDVIIGADVDDVDVGDDVTTVAKDNAKVARLEMRGDLAAAVATVQKLIETYLAIARVVLLKGEAKDLQRVTNASVRTLFIDALAKNEILRSAYGLPLIRMIRVAMQMAGEAFSAKALDMDITCKWAESLPVDQTEIANINAIMVPMHARSKRTAATKLGDNWAFEQAAIGAEVAADLERALEQASAMAEITPPDTPEDGPKTNGNKPGKQVKKTD